MQTIALQLTGTSPMLMHADTYANPLNPLTKAHKVLTSKRVKTDEDHEAIARSEWLGAMYFSTTDGPYIPTANIRSSIVEGAKLSKLGKAIQRGTLILADRAVIHYKGPRTLDALWDSGNYYDCRSVVIGGKRLMRYRPIFREWSLGVEIYFDPAVVEDGQILRAAQDAGNLIGLGDFRPNKGGSFGRFDVEVMKNV